MRSARRHKYFYDYLGCAVRVALDEYYVRNWSVWMDIDILLRTGWVVLRGNGAY